MPKGDDFRDLKRNPKSGKLEEAPRDVQPHHQGSRKSQNMSMGEYLSLLRAYHDADRIKSK